jgi:hypothetical protein
VATPSAQFAPSATVQITASKSILIRGSASLLRKVVVTAEPGP